MWCILGLFRFVGRTSINVRSGIVGGGLSRFVEGVFIVGFMSCGVVIVRGRAFSVEIVWVLFF